MRQILFRAKRIDNGEWVTGTPVFVEEYTDMYWWDSEEQLLRYTSVGRTTLCQFTGLTGKNGVKIFEGDIVARKGITVWEDYINEKGEKWSRPTSKKKDELGVVRYEEKFTQFTSDNSSIWLGQYDDIEIIGNRFDNPELLTT